MKPGSNNSQNIQRKYTAEIVFETLEIQKQLTTLSESIKAFYLSLQSRLLDETMFFSDDKGLPSLLYPLSVKFMELNNACAELKNIIEKKSALMQDTRFRRAWIRTGNLKLWIESKVSEHDIQQLQQHLEIQFNLLATFLHTMRKSLMESPCIDAIGGSYDERYLYHPMSTPLLTPLVIDEDLNKSNAQISNHDQALSESIHKSRAAFLGEFSIFRTEAVKISEINPNNSRKVMAELRRDFMPAS
jgi:hypothetical protein